MMKKRSRNCRQSGLVTRKTWGLIAVRLMMSALRKPRSSQKAMKMMRSKLYEYELDKKKAATRKIEDSKLEIGFGSQIRSYVLQPYRMAKDLRTRVEVGDVDRVLDGDLEPFIRGFLRMRREGNFPAPVEEDDVA